MSRKPDSGCFKKGQQTRLRQPHTKETLDKLEKSLYSKIRNKTYEEIYGKERGDKIRRSIRDAQTGSKRSDEARRNISLASKGKHKSEEHKIKLRENSYWKDKHIPREIKRKMRISALKYIKEICGDICPHIGHNEKNLLNELEKLFDYKIIRQHECEGYFLDGYISEINLAIEIDEKPKDKEKDIERQKIIEDKLNCKFLRINDFN